MRSIKSKTLIGFLLATLAGGLLSVRLSLSYSTNNTHPDLTKEIAKLHNLKDKKNRISSGEIKWMMEGAIQEDEPPRWINHFYDPVHKEGWNGNHYGDLSKEKGYETGADMAPKPAVSSVNWAENQEYQAAYGREFGNRTWQKAVKSYIDGDKKTAFLALGDILHLIEDLSVPAHTRNDSHPGLSGDPGSPYEDYAKETTNSGELSVAKRLIKENKTVPEFQKLSDAFDYLAEYSNKNFFSEDTISNDEFGEPRLGELKIISKKTREGVIRKYLFYNGTYLSIKNEDPFTGKVSYSIKDEALVLPSYYSHLVPKAVLTGAGVVNLFFRDVEKYKENPESLEPIVPDSNEPILDALKRAPKIIAIKTADSLDEAVISVQSALRKTKSSVLSIADTVKSGIVDFAESVIRRKTEKPSPALSRNLASAVDAVGGGSSGRAENEVGEVEELSGGAENSPVAGKTPLVPPRADTIPSTQREAPPRADRASDKPVRAGRADLLALSLRLAETRTALNKTSAAVAEATAPPKLETPKPRLGRVESRLGRTKFAINQPYPGFGGGGGASSSRGETSSVATAENTEGEKESNGDEKEKPDTVPPLAPEIRVPSDFSRTFTSPDIVFSGTAEASSTVSAVFGAAITAAASTTADSTGEWTLPLSFKQGSSTVAFFASDASGNTSSSTEISLFVDSEAPELSLSAAECANSLSNESCLVATTTLNFTWSSPADDLSFFIINDNGVFSTTSATSTTVAAENNSTHSFSVSAVDILGNRSATSTVSVVVSTMPVVINEVAWAGTAASFADEWIELYNRTNYPVDLSGWTLYSETDMKPYIKLSGTIPAKGYYLIERTDASTTSETADLIYSEKKEKGMGLNNDGEILALSFASATMDRTPDILHGWAGGTRKYRTMERINPDLPGEDPLNWGTNNEIIKNGTDAEGNYIYGTPKARNSVNYLINNGSPVTSEITLTKENSPYIVFKPQIFRSGAVLNIGPGTVIKFAKDSGFDFIGDSKIIAKGTEDEPIIFTSFADDEYGGDTDGDAASPSEGDWYGIRIRTDNDDSLFSHTVFRYGGWYYKGGQYLGRANLNIANTSATVTNSVFEQSKVYGLLLSNSSSTVSDSVFRENNKSASSAGLRAEGGGAPEIANNFFTNNGVGLELSNTPATVRFNEFASPTRPAVLSAGVIGTFSGNTGEGNIALSGRLAAKNSTTTLETNSLPYFIKSAETAASSTLIVSKGVVLKGDSPFKIGGNLKIEGEKPEDILLSPAEGARGFSIVIGKNGSLDANGFTAENMGSESAYSKYKGAFNFLGSSGRISDALFNSNHPYGIYAENSNNLIIRNSTFKDGETALAVLNSTTTLSNILFKDNTLGVRNFGSSTFSASKVTFENEDNRATTSPEGLW